MKNVLIIAYYFPPLGWSGVQRTLKFVKYLKNYNWNPIVVTVGETKFNILDQTLNSEIPEDIKVIRINDLKLKDKTDEMSNNLKSYVSCAVKDIISEELKKEYYEQIEKKFSELRELLLIPDGNVIWANNVIEQIEKKMDMKDIDLVYTTSSPYSVHLIGYYLKQKKQIPWVADFRDEWINNACYTFDVNDIKYRISEYMEKIIVNNCDKVITTTPFATKNFQERYNLDQKIITITNGYDEDDFKNIHIQYSTKFRIIHSGSFYLNRTPDTFLYAIRNLFDKKLINNKNLEIIFVGENNENIMKQCRGILEDYNVVKEIPYCSHNKALNLLMNSNLLMLIVGDLEKQKSIYPGKVFEYLRTKKPIISISPKDSAIEQLINSTTSGINIEYNNVIKIEEAILYYYNKWKNNEEIINKQDVSQYERKILTKKLSNVFNELLEHSRIGMIDNERL